MGRNTTCSILLAEDDRVDAKAFLRAAREAGLANPVVVASDGVEAWEMLAGPGALVASPGLVVLDINMPRMTGLELLRRMRAEPRLRALPVCMLTTSDDQRDRLQARGLDVAGYLLKSDIPGSFGQVLELLDNKGVEPISGVDRFDPFFQGG